MGWDTISVIHFAGGDDLSWVDLPNDCHSQSMNRVFNTKSAIEGIRKARWQAIEYIF